MAQPLQQQPRLRDRPDAVGVDRDVAERGRPGHRDAQAARLARRGGRERLRRRWRPAGVAVLGPGEDVEQRGGLADGPGEDAVLHEELLAELGRVRHAAALRLEADQAAARRRDAQRAAAVVAVRERHHARGDRGCAPAGRAPGGSCRIPGVPRPLGDGQDPPLGHRRRADHDRARGTQPTDDVVVVRRAHVAHERGAARQAQPGDRPVRLHRDRDPRQRPGIARRDLGGRGARARVVDLDERTEVRVERLDPRERELDELEGRHVSCADETGELGRRSGQQIVAGHAAHPTGQ